MIGQHIDGVPLRAQRLGEQPDRDRRTALLIEGLRGDEQYPHIGTSRAIWAER